MNKLLLGITLFLSLTLSHLAHAANAPLNCFIKTYSGHYLTAVGGGGRTVDVLHTDARWTRAWEQFRLIDIGEGSSQYGFQTRTGHYLTVVGGGGRITDVIHSDATQLRNWEKIRLVSLGYGWYALQTYTGHYLTAVGGGGRTTDVIHSNATAIGNWEKFRFYCRR
jgi:hypothetical protein